MTVARRSLVLLLTTLAGAAALLLIPLPSRTRLGGALTDLAHAPLFAGLMIIFWRLRPGGRPRNRPVACLLIWMGLCLFGGIAEWVQGQLGRQASWQDLSANLLGSTAGAVWVASPIPGWRRLVGRLASAGLLIVAAWTPGVVLWDVGQQQVEFPVLASFESGREITRWSFRECRHRLVRCTAIEGDWALQLDLLPGGYAGLAMSEPPPDWSQYSEFAFDAYIDDGSPLDLIVKITDQQHDWRTEDRFERLIRLQPGWQTIHISLADVAEGPRTRRLNLQQVGFLQLFAAGLSERRALRLDFLRLQ